MSTIEQAAKRLEQLRQSGVDVGAAAGSGPSLAESASVQESVPLRVARELEAHGAAIRQPARATRTEPAVVPARPRAAHPRGDRSRAAVGQRLRDAAAARSRLAEEFRVIKRPLLTNARGKSAAPIVQRQPHHGHQCVGGRGQDLCVAQPGDEHRDGTRHQRAAGRCRRLAAGRARPAWPAAIARPARPAGRSGAVARRMCARRPTSNACRSFLQGRSNRRQPSCWRARA